MVKGVKMIVINDTMWEVKQNTLYHIEYVNNRKNTICEVSDLSGLEVWEFIKLVDEVKFHYPDYDIKNLYNFSGVEVYKNRRSTKNLNLLNWDNEDGCPVCNGKDVESGKIWDGIDYLHYICYNENCQAEYGIATGNYPGFRVQYINDITDNDLLIDIINRYSKGVK